MKFLVLNFYFLSKAIGNGGTFTAIAKPTHCQVLIKSQFIHELDFSVLFMNAAAAAKSLQLCPTLCDPIDGSPPGSLVPGILQARTLEWVAISFSNE